MARFPHYRLAVAVLGVLHFIAAPCVMARAAADAEVPCEHCPPGGDAMPCLTTVTSDAGEIAPGPGRTVPAAPAAVVPMLLVPVEAATMLPHRASPARRIAFATGRHPGDPPLSILQQKFLN
jgi:hypothetical protein